MIPGLLIPKVDREMTVLLGDIPREAPSGWILRALKVIVQEEVLPNPHHYWVLRVGTIGTGGAFHTLFEKGLQDGLPTRLVRFELPGRPRLVQGDTIAVRFALVGLAASLEGLSLVPEYGIFGSRRA